MSAMNYFPDNWVVLKLKDGKLDRGCYKVLAGWSGGYLHGDSWRMNSGIERVTDEGDYLKFWGYSGSCYVVYKKAYGLRMSTSGVYNSLKKQETFENQLSIMDADTDWVNMSW